MISSAAFVADPESIIIILASVLTSSTAFCAALILASSLDIEVVYVVDEGFVEGLVGTYFVGAKHFTAKAPLAKQNGFPG